MGGGTIQQHPRKKILLFYCRIPDKLEPGMAFDFFQPINLVVIQGTIPAVEEICILQVALAQMVNLGPNVALIFGDELVISLAQADLVEIRYHITIFKTLSMAGEVAAFGQVTVTIDVDLLQV